MIPLIDWILLFSLFTIYYFHPLSMCSIHLHFLFFLFSPIISPISWIESILWHCLTRNCIFESIPIVKRKRLKSTRAFMSSFQVTSKTKRMGKLLVVVKMSLYNLEMVLKFWKKKQCLQWRESFKTRI